jgi:hypothetical protein
VRKAISFVREREQRVALSAAEATARMLAEEENDESKDQAETDRKSEGNDGHGRSGWWERGWK